MLNRALNPLQTWAGIWLSLFILNMSCFSVHAASSSTFQQKPTTSAKFKVSSSSKSASTSKSSTKSKKKKGSKPKRSVVVDSMNIDPTQVKVPLFQNP